MLHTLQVVFYILCILLFFIAAAIGPNPPAALLRVRLLCAAGGFGVLAFALPVIAS